MIIAIIFGAIGIVLIVVGSNIALFISIGMGEEYITKFCNGGYTNYVGDLAEVIRKIDY